MSRFIFMLGFIMLSMTTSVGQIRMSEIIDSLYFKNNVVSAGYLLSEVKGNVIHYIHEDALSNILIIDSANFVNIKLHPSDYDLAIELKKPPHNGGQGNNFEKFVAKYMEFLLRIEIKEINRDGVRLTINIGMVNRTNFVEGKFDLLAQKRACVHYIFDEGGNLKFKALEEVFIDNVSK